jgi:serine/threonine protein kinase
MALTTPSLRVFLGKYQVVRRLGEGGMAQVFLAIDRNTGREVVVKVMHLHLARNPTVRQHFGRELELMKRFRHPGAVAWLDGSVQGLEPCLVMEYVRGVNLDDYTHPRGSIALRRVANWLGQVCQVLHAAHSAGILHRDLSLANLMLVDADTPKETIKVLDFGLARLTGALYVPIEKLTGEGTNTGGGTPDYICPEQVRGDSVDARGDIYSVGIILFKLLTGRFPFQQFDKAEDLLRAQVELPPPRFAEVGANRVPAPIEAVVQHCLAKFPSERPGSAKELAERFGDAYGAPIAPPEAFSAAAALEESAPVYNPRHVVDRFEAFMPEQIAAVKLRGFVHDLGGEVLDSQPGHIRMRLPEHRQPPPEQQSGFSWFGKKRAALPEPRFFYLDLHMSKKQVGPKSMVEIALVMRPRGDEARLQAQMREGFVQRVARDLRAYLITGR